MTLNVLTTQALAATAMNEARPGVTKTTP